MDFNSIVGQKDIIDSLKNAIVEERVGHAYMLAGPRGIGKRLLALTFAKTLLCQSPKDGKCCGECMQCRMQKSGTSPDLYVIDTDEQSIGVDEIRNLQSDIVIKPAYSKRKVYVIADCDKMTVQAQNCLLKTLEEPPRYATILLTASNMGVILETIHSRTIHYNMKKNTNKEVYDYLVENYGGKLDNNEFIAAFSDGIIGTAIEAAESSDFLMLRENVIQMLLKLCSNRMLDIFKACDFFEKNKTDIENILNIMLLFYRDMLIAKVSREENMLINSDKKDIILNNVDIFSLHGLVNCIEIIEMTKLNLKKNANYQLSIEVMLMKLQEECS